MSSLGHNAATIGLLISLTLAIKVLGAPLWGAMADRGSRYWVIVWASFASWLASGLFFYGDSLLLLLIGTLSFSLFQNAQLSLVEATTLETIDRNNNKQNIHMDYGRIRLWGSWGFIVFAMGLGALIDVWGIFLVPWALTLLLLASAMLSLALPKAESRPLQGVSPALFSLPSVRWFYLTALLMQFSHGAYYGFMSLHLESYGFSRTSIGFLWTLGVAAEVLLLRHSGPLLLRFGISRVLTGAVFLAMLRWSLYSIPPAWPILLVGQLLHAFTFGAFHVAAVRRTFEMAPYASRSTALAWYTALSFGLGGGMGILICGHLYEKIGAEAIFVIMAGVAALGIFAAIRASYLFAKEVNYA